MKKNSLVIVLSLVLVFLCGCGQDYYLIEKQYYRIRKEARKIYNNPFGSPPKELERVVGLFRGFVQQYPNNNLSLEAQFEIARLYAVKEEYVKAREQLKSIIEKYSNAKTILTEAIFLTGNTYQAEDNWNAALAQYKKIIRDYPTTSKGLRMPMYIARYYEFKHQPDKMIAAYQEAARHYQTLRSKSNNPLLNYILSGLLARSYVQLKEWGNALATYQGMLDEHMGKTRLAMDTVLMEMTLIYNRELKQKDKAKETLSLLLKNYPASRYAKVAQRLLKEMSKNEQP